MSVRLVVSACTDVGRVRDHNEDGYLVDADLGLVAVADGMGGHRGGEVASATALERLREAFTTGPELAAAVAAANDAVFERSSADDAVRGMGTTLTAAALDDAGDTLVIGHVGDSRAYLWRDGQLRRLTTDHSLVEELVAAGELTEAEAERDPRRSMITRALGLEPGVRVDVEEVELLAGDRLLLCSDGLTTMITESEAAAILAAQSEPADAARHLVDAANGAGGADNVTVLVVDVIDDAGDEDTQDEVEPVEAIAPPPDELATQELPEAVVDVTTDEAESASPPEPPAPGEPAPRRRRWWRRG